jgi:hypothetical protein
MSYEDTSTVNRWWELPQVDVFLRLAENPMLHPRDNRRTEISFRYNEQEILRLSENDRGWIYWKGFMRDDRDVSIRIRPEHSPHWGNLHPTAVYFTTKPGKEAVVFGSEKDFEYWQRVLRAVGVKYHHLEKESAQKEPVSA